MRRSGSKSCLCPRPPLPGWDSEVQAAGVKEAHGGTVVMLSIGALVKGQKALLLPGATWQAFPGSHPG